MGSNISDLFVVLLNSLLSNFTEYVAYNNVCLLLAFYCIGPFSHGSKLCLLYQVNFKADTMFLTEIT